MAEKKCRCGGALVPREVSIQIETRCPACGAAASEVLRRPVEGPASEGSVAAALHALLPSPADAAVEARLAEAPTVTPGPPPTGRRGPEPRVGISIGPFHLVRRLGEGGMGVVYQAHDISLDREVAIKFLSPHLTEQPEFVQRFRREAQAAARVSHPNITHIYSIGEEEGRHYFAMEMIDGRSIAEILQDRKRIPYQEAAGLVLQAARGLAQAHEKVGIIHRDVKPSNLLVTADGTVKVTDFGLAKVAVAPSDLTQSGTILGTPLYMSPEQGKGGPFDHRSDIYSLGATLYHMLYGKPPFEGSTSFEVLFKHATEYPKLPVTEEVPASAVAVLRRALAKRPADRYASYEPFIVDLAKLAAGEIPGDPESDEDTNRITFVDLACHLDPGKLGTMEKSRFRLAETNLQLGRREKAIALLREMLADPPPVRVFAALKLIAVHEERGEQEEVRSLAERVLFEAADPDIRAYAAWKIATGIERAALGLLEKTLEALKAIPLDSRSLPHGLVPAKIEDIEQRIKRTAYSLKASDVRLRPQAE